MNEIIRGFSIGTSEHLTQADAKLFDSLVNEAFGSYPLPVVTVNAQQYFPHYRNQLFVDVGANVGAVSIALAAANIYQNVVALEPNKKNYNFLERAIKHTQIENIEILNVGVGGCDEERTLFEAHDVSPDSTLYDYGSTDPGNSYRVKVISFQSLCDYLKEEYDEESIDYLKVDCEGAEYEFLWDQDLSNVRTLAMELHGCPTKELKGRYVEEITKEKFLRHIIKFFKPCMVSDCLFFGQSRRFYDTDDCQEEDLVQTLQRIEHNSDQIFNPAIDVTFNS